MTTQTFSRPVVNESGYTVGYPNVASENDLLQAVTPNPYAESAIQLFPVGTKLTRGEEVWRYAKAGSSGLNIAAPTQQAAAVHAEQDDDIAVGAASAIGALTVTLTSTANLDGAPNNVDNDFAEGYLIVNDQAGEGQLYKIKANEALVTTGDSIFTLYDPLTIALTTSSQVGIVRAPYYKTIVSAAVVSGMFTGIPQIAVTANYWYWSKTGGPASCIAQAAIALGTEVVIGTSSGKADPAAAATTELCIGYAITPGVADGESFMVFLTGDR